MNRPKYIADGFMTDIRKLLNDFVNKQSMDFKTFADVWKDQHFVCILMARPNIKELIDFVNEIYQHTLNNFMSSSSEYKIGCVYVLYALFRSQITILNENPVLIRVIPGQYVALNSLREYAIKNKLYSLVYVLEYLFTNCLRLVAFPTLFGPFCTNSKMENMDNKANDMDDVRSLNSDILKDFEDIKSLHGDYLKQKKGSYKERREILNHTVREYDKINNRLGRLQGDETYLQTSTEIDETIGRRRSMLKQQSFARKAMFRQLNETEDDEEPIPDDVSTIVKKERDLKKPAPKKKRGRPFKAASDKVTKPKLPITKEGKREYNSRGSRTYIKKETLPNLETLVLNIGEDEQEESVDEDVSDDSSVGDVRF